MEHLTFLILYY